MKHIFVILALNSCIALISAYGQPCVQGIINIYTPVLDFECAGNTVVVQSSTGFQANDLVLLIQMQGATCTQDNNASFGNLTQLNHAGNYEINRIQSIQDNKIAMQFERTREYDISGKVQLIRIPEYNNVNVCNLTCKAWDGETGGVLILQVTNQLSLSGPIDVSGKGFRGGILNNANSTSDHETNYFYSLNPVVSAAKGEGIAQIPFNQSYGRGKVANGGGGGNAHNSGGGGGGSFGGGGRGGTEFSHTVPDLNTFGIGGLNLPVNSDRLFMGGGGGSGHSNDDTGSGGGNGGGIAIILAGTIAANGFPVLSNGQDKLGGSFNNDGQGGGGAGGAIAIHATSVGSSLNVQAKGGTGGNSIFLNAPGQLIGPGGGGGGGGLILYHSTTGITGDFAGGAHGLANGNVSYGSENGAAGTSISNIPIPLDTLAFDLVSDVVLMHPDCHNLNNGSIQVVADAVSFTLEGITNSNGFFNNLDTGIYTISLVFSDGCETATTATLTGESLLTQDIFYSICVGDTLFLNDHIYASATIVYDTLPSQSNGCDTLLTIHITQTDYILTQETYSICPGKSIIIDGIEFFEPGILIDTLPNSGTGCDTIHNTVVTWGFSPQISELITFCPGDTVFLGSLFFTSPFTWMDTLDAVVGCDTIRTTTGSFFSDQPGSFLEQYQTFCPGETLVLYSPYPGTMWNNQVNGQYFTVASAGTITVYFPDANGCTQRDTVKIGTCCSTETIYVPNIFAPESNTASNVFKIHSTPACILLRLQIYNRWGALLFQTDIPEEGWDGRFKGSYCEPGVYIWLLETAQNGQLKKEVLKGDVTIVR